MRRLLTLAAFLLIISVLPLRAQRGGHASGGSHGGFSGHSGFSGHAGGMSAAGGFHGGSFAARGSSLHVASASHSSFSRNRNVHGSRIFSHRYGNRCYGCLGYGYPFYGYYDPYWWWDSSSYDGDAERERNLASEMNAENLDEQRMRQQEQDAYSQPAYGPPSRAAMQTSREQAPADPPTVLVFRDQHQREIQNYAIVGQTLWVFSSQRSEKISLAQLDIPATTKVNDDRGVDFRLPRAAEGQ